MTAEEAKARREARRIAQKARRARARAKEPPPVGATPLPTEWRPEWRRPKVRLDELRDELATLIQTRAQLLGDAADEGDEEEKDLVSIMSEAVDRLPQEMQDLFWATAETLQNEMIQKKRGLP